MINNKKGIEKIMTIWWFFIWVMIIVGVVVDVAMFSNRNIDYRPIDAITLADKMTLCINQNNIDLFQDKTKIDIINDCSFYKDTFENGEHAIRITVGQDKNIEISKGSVDMFKQCEMKAESKSGAKQYPECFSEETLIKNAGVEYTVKIEASSNLQGKRVLSLDVHIK
jgi:hypothetical protein